MKILIYSTKYYQEKKIGWFRGGDNIAYKSNGLWRTYELKSKPQTFKEEMRVPTFKTLTFQYKFQYDNDEVYFA